MADIPKDKDRFKQIVRGKRPKGFEGIIGQGGFKFNKGKKTISVPIPHIGTPIFREKPDSPTGIGQGAPGKKPGDKLGPYKPQEGDGGGKAGDKPGDHGLEDDFNLEELIKRLGKELELPNMRETAHGRIYDVEIKWTGVRKHGKKVLFKRSFRNALKRTLAEDGVLPEPDEYILPVIEHPDKLYRGPRMIFHPISQAVIFYIMDISGSMIPTKDIVRTEAFWIDAWIRYQFGDKNVDSRYVVHDTKGWEVPWDEFFRQSPGGGTKISSGFNVVSDIIKTDYQPIDTWNVYIFDFTDGDNWDNNNEEVIDVIENELLEVSNQISIVQVESTYGSGRFGPKIESHFDGDDRIVVSYIKDENDIAMSLKEILGKDRSKTALMRDGLRDPGYSGAYLEMTNQGFHFNYKGKKTPIAVMENGVLVPTADVYDLDYLTRGAL